MDAGSARLEELIYIMNENEDFTIEEGFEQLDDIIEKMEDGGASLDETFSLYKNGMDLLKRVSERIDRVEKDVLKLDEDGGLSVFDAADDDGE